MHHVLSYNVTARMNYVIATLMRHLHVVLSLHSLLGTWPGSPALKHTHTYTHAQTHTNTHTHFLHSHTYIHMLIFLSIFKLLRMQQLVFRRIMAHPDGTCAYLFIGRRHALADYFSNRPPRQLHGKRSRGPVHVNVSQCIKLRESLTYS